MRDAEQGRKPQRRQVPIPFSQMGTVRCREVKQLSHLDGEQTNTEPCPHRSGNRLIRTDRALPQGARAPVRREAEDKKAKEVTPGCLEIASELSECFSPLMKYVCHHPNTRGQQRKAASNAPSATSVTTREQSLTGQLNKSLLRGVRASGSPPSPTLGVERPGVQLVLPLAVRLGQATDWVEPQRSPLQGALFSFDLQQPGGTRAQGCQRRNAGTPPLDKQIL